MIFIDSNRSESLELPPKLERLILIGNDLGFARIINLCFGDLQKQDATVIFIPIGRSALTEGLKYPTNPKGLAELIKSKYHLSINLMRCHCMDLEGRPLTWLALNDVVIRLPEQRIPSPLAGLVKRFLFSSRLFAPKTKSQISVLDGNRVIYDGKYLFSVLLLGSRISGGPKLREHTRGFQQNFSYYQVNEAGPLKAAKGLIQLFSQDEENQEMLKGNFTQLELRSLAEESQLVADGLTIGHLPANFTLLPKALKVASPLLTSPVKNGFKAILPEAEGLSSLSRQVRNSSFKNVKPRPGSHLSEK